MSSSFPKKCFHHLGIALVCAKYEVSGNYLISYIVFFIYLKRTELLSHMAKKLYVGGLPYSTSDAELKSHFEQAGTVESATIIMDKMSGRSKGFGFVEMASDEEAAKAIEMFNGQDFGGRNLTVNEARPMEDRPARSGNGGGYGGGSRGGQGGGYGGGASRGRRDY